MEAVDWGEPVSKTRQATIKKGLVLKAIEESAKAKKKKEATFAITVRLPESTYLQVSQHAAELGLSRNEWILRIIDLAFGRSSS
jgi:predicted DNA binding CopG/RHH family protein